MLSQAQRTRLGQICAQPLPIPSCRAALLLLSSPSLGPLAAWQGYPGWNLKTEDLNTRCTLSGQDSDQSVLHFKKHCLRNWAHDTCLDLSRVMDHDLQIMALVRTSKHYSKSCQSFCSYCFLHKDSMRNNVNSPILFLHLCGKDQPKIPAPPPSCAFRCQRSAANESCLIFHTAWISAFMHLEAHTS